MFSGITGRNKRSTGIGTVNVRPVEIRVHGCHTEMVCPVLRHISDLLVPHKRASAYFRTFSVDEVKRALCERIRICLCRDDTRDVSRCCDSRGNSVYLCSDSSRKSHWCGCCRSCWSNQQTKGNSAYDCAGNKGQFQVFLIHCFFSLGLEIGVHAMQREDQKQLSENYSSN